MKRVSETEIRAYVRPVKHMAEVSHKALVGFRGGEVGTGVWG
jgi:hypothetical protein